MIRKIFSVILALAVCLPLLNVGVLAESKFSGGTGTELDPYLISDVDDLKELATDVNRQAGSMYSGIFFRMTGDIDLKNEPWTPIGGNSENGSSTRERFAGTFDGGGHEIKGLNVTGGHFAGLFGAISGGTVMNLTVSGSVSGGTSYSGGIVAYNSLGTIDNCVNKCSVASTEESSSYNKYIGGIAGFNYDGTIKNCRNEGTITGTDYNVGGIAGVSKTGGIAPTVIENCWNKGTVSIQTEKGYCVGGIVGKMDVGIGHVAEITNCYNVADISNKGTGASDVGGIAGDNSHGIIENCYNIGGLSNNGTGTVGGIAGSITTTDSNTVEVTGCYYLDTAANDGYGEIDGENTKIDITKITSAQLKEESTFKDWDFNKTWNMRASLGRPVLLTPTSERLFEGSGTEKDPYVIDTAGVMLAFAQTVNSVDSFEGKFVKPGDDIDLSDVCGGDKGSWEPVGIFDNNNDGKPFEGTFDGDGHTVSGLYIDRTGSNADGLFGYIGKKGVVKNLTVEGEVKGESDVGGIAGHNEGTISNCHNDADVECGSGGNSVGGIAGSNSGTIENCYNTGAVSGGSGSHIGGVIGEDEGDAVRNYYLEGAAEGGIDGVDVSGEAESKTETQFRYGEVAFLLDELSGHESDIFWGQQLAEEPLDEYPILTDDESLRVVKFDLTYTDSEGEENELYANLTAEKAPVPAESSVTIGDTTIEFPNGGFIHRNNDRLDVTVPEDGSIRLNDDYTVTLPDGGAARVDEDGVVTVPAGTVIVDISGEEEDLTVPDGKVAIYDPKTGKFTLDDAPEPEEPDDPNAPADGTVPFPAPGTSQGGTSQGNSSGGNNSDGTDPGADGSDVIGPDACTIIVDTGSGAVDVWIEENSAAALREEIVTKHLTDEEIAAVAKGAKLEVVLSAELAEGALYDDDRQIIEAYIAGTDYSLGKHFSLSLHKLIDGQQVDTLTRLNTPIRLVFVIPEELRKEDRIFAVVRVHDGKAELLPDQDDNPNTVTVITDRFSTYTLVYRDPAGSGNPSTGAVLVIAPLIAAAAGVILSKKRR